MTGFLRGALISLVCLASGCSYQLGSIKVGENQKIAIPTFTNKTGQPDLETRATNAVIAKMKVDGSYKVVANPSDADYVLLGELTSYSRDAVSFDRSDITQEYRGTLSAKLIFKEAKTAKVLWTTSRVEGQATFAKGSDQAENERAAFPRLVDDLAKFVVEKVVDGGW